jgi:hypothetical protein
MLRGKYVRTWNKFPHHKVTTGPGVGILHMRMRGAEWNVSILRALCSTRGARREAAVCVMRGAAERVMNIDLCPLGMYKWTGYFSIQLFTKHVTFSGVVKSQRK